MPWGKRMAGRRWNGDLSSDHRKQECVDEGGVCGMCWLVVMGGERKEQSDIAIGTLRCFGREPGASPTEIWIIFEFLWVPAGSLWTSSPLQNPPNRNAPTKYFWSFPRESHMCSWNSLSPLAPPLLCPMPWCQVTLLGPFPSAQAVTLGVLVLSTALQAPQQPGVGRNCPPAGLGDAAVALSTTVTSQCQHPFPLICMSPTSLQLSSQGKQVSAHDCDSRAEGNDAGALPSSCRVVW